MENNNILTDKKVHNGNGNSDPSLDSGTVSSHKAIEGLLGWSSPEMYIESMEELLEAWILSENLPEVRERDSIYIHYRHLIQFLKDL